MCDFKSLGIAFYDYVDWNKLSERTESVFGVSGEALI